MSAKSPAKKKVAAKSTHPMYKDMIAAAIKALANRKGSSKQAISKYISANYKVGATHESLLRKALLRGLESGALVKKSGLGCSGSFRLAKAVAAPKKVATKKAAPKKTATPKKKAAPKKKVSAKKAAPKKKAATPKKKAAPKKKVAATKKKPTAKKATPKKAKK